MSGHNHTEFMPRCYRCHLSRDEARDSQTETLTEASRDARLNSYNGAVELDDMLADLFVATIEAIADGSLAPESNHAIAVTHVASAYLDQEEA